jgi:hypothetical protein
MPPCTGASTPGAGVTPVTLPSTIVASQPPPSVALNPALLAQLAASAPSASLSIVQWGVSPVPETAGTAAIAYKPLVKAGTLAAAADAVVAETDDAAAGSREQKRRLGFGSLLLSLTSFTRGVFNGAPLRRYGATVAANAALRAAVPRPLMSYDRLASRPMDTRVVSIAVAPLGGGAPLLLASLTAPYTVTLPLRDLSVVRYDAATGSSTIEVGTAAFAPRVLSVVCPTSSASAARGVAARYTAPPELFGKIAPVAVLNVSSVAFSGLSAITEGAYGGDVGFGGALVGDGGGIAAPPTPAPAPSGALSYLLTTACGAPFANGTFLCGPGTEGANFSFACPTVVPTPACLWFDKSAGGWSATGCVVANVTETAFVCSCTAPLPADFAGRFAALDLPDNDLFAVEAPTLVMTPPPAPFLVPLLAACVAAAGVWVATAVKAREDGEWGRYAERVAADGEVVWLTAALGGGGPLPELAQWRGVGRARQRRVAPAPKPGAAGGGGAVAAPPPLPLLPPPAALKSPTAKALGALAAALIAPLQPCAPPPPPASDGADSGDVAPPPPRAPRPPTPSQLLLPLAFARCARRSPLAAASPTFDPLLPAPARVLALAAAAAFSLYTAFGGVGALVRAGAAQAGALFAVAALSGAALCAFYWAALALLVAPLGARLWSTRFPVLAAELARRRAGDGDGDGDGDGGGGGDGDGGGDGGGGGGSDGDGDGDGGEEDVGEEGRQPQQQQRRQQQPSLEQATVLAEGWARVVDAAAEARAGAPPDPAAAWAEWRARAPLALLAAAFLFFAFGAYAGEALRGPVASRVAAGAWVLGVALAGALFAPLGEACCIGAHLFLLPAAAPLLRVVLPSRLFAAVDPSRTLTAEDAVAGRLAALFFGGVGAAAAAAGAGRRRKAAAAAVAEEAVAAAAPLLRVARALRRAAAAEAARGGLLAARLAAAAVAWRGARGADEAAEAAAAGAAALGAAEAAVRPPPRALPLPPPPQPPLFFPHPRAFAPPALDALDAEVAAAGDAGARPSQPFVRAAMGLTLPPLGVGARARAGAPPGGAPAAGGRKSLAAREALRSHIKDFV